ncbi:MAG: non-canonical purine NTP pyrophosphatase [Spirochaetales bacterium]
MILVLATGNPHKKEELTVLFKGYTLLIPDELNISYYHEETGTTYLENALGKATTLYQELRRKDYTNFAILSDDSGLSIPALGGAPGIHSARFGEKELGRKPTYAEQHQILLSRLAKVENRKAYFVCCMVLFLHPERYFIAQETLEGEIAHKPMGSGGFGYDPLLYLPNLGKTVAQLDMNEKNALSHRGAAARAIRILLENHLERSIYGRN